MWSGSPFEKQFYIESSFDVKNTLLKLNSCVITVSQKEEEEKEEGRRRKKEENFLAFL